MGRAFSPCLLQPSNLGRCPRLLSGAPLALRSAVGATRPHTHARTRTRTRTRALARTHTRARTQARGRRRRRTPRRWSRSTSCACPEGATPRPIVAWGNAPGIAVEPARAEGPAHAVGTLRWSGLSALGSCNHPTWGVAPGYYRARRWRFGVPLALRSAVGASECCWRFGALLALRSAGRAWSEVADAFAREGFFGDAVHQEGG